MFVTLKFYRVALATSAVLLATLAGTNLAAHAASPADSDPYVVERVISAAGLDLTTRAGQAGLRHRLDKAARELCAEVTGGQSYADANFDDCARNTVKAAWPQAQAQIALAQARVQYASATASK